MESRLVLEAVGIPTEMVHQGGQWLLLVRAEDRAAANMELAAYRLDKSADAVPERVPIRLFQGAAAGVFVYAVILILIGVVSGSPDSRPLWVATGRMRAGDVMAGQWWRTFTALTLHADAEHLMSNLAFGSVFGFLAGQILGGGVAWLTIVVAGALGNFMNALVRGADHASIGASTAVFAALGVMVAHALRPRSAARQAPLKRWSPLIGGILLLSFLGLGGERTDVAAHVTGFLGGVMLGWVGCRVPERWLSNGNVQSWAGGIAVGLVLLAWGVAVATAR